MCTFLRVRPDCLAIRLYPYLNMAGCQFKEVAAGVFMFLLVYPVTFTKVQLSRGNHYNMYKSHFTALKIKYMCGIYINRLVDMIIFIKSISPLSDDPDDNKGYKVRVKSNFVFFLDTPPSYRWCRSIYFFDI